MKKTKSLQLVAFTIVLVLTVGRFTANSTDYGICIGSIFFDDEQTINNKLDLLQEAGVEWIRLVFPWSEIERTADNYVFEGGAGNVRFDTVVEKVGNRGI